YGNSYEQLQQKRNEIEQKIDEIIHRSDVIAKQEKEVKDAYEQFKQKAEKLHIVRSEKAKLLEQEIVHQLQDLHLSNAQFCIQIEESDANKYGLDKVEFLISMNKGEPLRSLQKVASGGELSRLMLGLKTIFSTLQGIQTIIFDEIDTGVSGRVAFSIGKKMQVLSAKTQVFCVTHLAQVAACAHHHYLVKKEQKENGTTTHIQLLDEKELILQLASIASDSHSESAQCAAKELYEKAHENSFN
ncbi:MAG: DNA repair protein RecN, partial [Erysipelotrichaceae bacterium]|nr:DNA repair protein RecN [Erysipelotrichaceae bacterium]